MVLFMITELPTQNTLLLTLSVTKPLHHHPPSTPNNHHQYPIQIYMYMQRPMTHGLNSIVGRLGEVYLRKPELNLACAHDLPLWAITNYCNYAYQFLLMIVKKKTAVQTATVPSTDWHYHSAQ